MYDIFIFKTFAYYLLWMDLSMCGIVIRKLWSHSLFILVLSSFCCVVFSTTISRKQKMLASRFVSEHYVISRASESITIALINSFLQMLLL